MRAGSPGHDSQPHSGVSVSGTASCTPFTNREGIGSWTAEEDLLAFQAEVAESVLVCAHTHRPLIRETETGLVVNVGSVGLPFNRDRRAQYAILRRGGQWGWEHPQRPVQSRSSQ